MTKSQIADYLAGKAGVTKKTAVQILDELASLAYREAKNVFTVPGIGKLKLANRKARIGRNPQTGEEIKIPAKRVVKFRVAKVAKDATGSAVSCIDEASSAATDKPTRAGLPRGTPALLFCGEV
jgi:DNA-binding protein HU-beta